MSWDYIAPTVNKENENQRCSDSVTKQMQTESAFTSFLKPWMLNNTSGFCLQLFHCNVLQIFIFNHIYFLAKDVFFPLHTDWQFLHWHLVIKKISKVAIFFSRCSVNRRNIELNLYDWFHQKGQLSAL